MRRFIHAAAFAAFTALSLGLPAHAASSPVLTVEGVVSPAWVERADGKREPLAVGMALNDKEKVHTGANSRALLRLSEGSAIKLGENAVLALDRLTHQPGEQSAKQQGAKQQGAEGGGGVVGASLEVIRGAFRFTTGLLGKATAQRNVSVKVQAVTAGIRGTDVWGKAEMARDVVCLLEGRITVTHGANEFAMQEPNSFYIAPHQGPPLPIAMVSAEQLREWSDETEIQPGAGAVRRDGKYRVEILGRADWPTAQAQSTRLQNAGFPALARETDLGGTQVEVRIDGFADPAEARAMAERLKKLGYAAARAVQ